MVSNNSKKVLVLGTGGTIAGLAAQVTDNVGYQAAQVAVGELLGRVPGLEALLRGWKWEAEQVAQVDSKDMSFSIWQGLALRVGQALGQPDVAAVLITHGTDTLEETAFFLHRVLPADLLATKPVLFACAMRPASALVPDGPQNLADALAVARTPGARGVMVVCAGSVHAAMHVQKVHSYRLDAFSSGDAGVVGFVEEGRLRLQHWPVGGVATVDLSLAQLGQVKSWPRVEIVMNYVGASAATVDALLAGLPGAARLRGIVVAGTGNGNLHHSLEQSLLQAQSQGVQVVRATRCAFGQVVPTGKDKFADSGGLSPVKARIAMMLSLLAQDSAA